jgi:hypothetical protein
LRAYGALPADSVQPEYRLSPSRSAKRWPQVDAENGTNADRERRPSSAQISPTLHVVVISGAHKDFVAQNHSTAPVSFDGNPP